jgi:hypothetical protein
MQGCEGEDGGDGAEENLFAMGFQPREGGCCGGGRPGGEERRDKSSRVRVVAGMAEVSCLPMLDLLFA